MHSRPARKYPWMDIVNSDREINLNQNWIEFQSISHVKYLYMAISGTLALDNGGIYLQAVSAPLYYLETVDDGNQTKEEWAEDSCQDGPYEVVFWGRHRWCWSDNRYCLRWSKNNLHIIGEGGWEEYVGSNRDVRSTGNATWQNIMQLVLTCTVQWLTRQLHGCVRWLPWAHATMDRLPLNTRKQWLHCSRQEVIAWRTKLLQVNTVGTWNWEWCSAFPYSYNVSWWHVHTQTKQSTPLVVPVQLRAHCHIWGIPLTISSTISRRSRACRGRQLSYVQQ